MPGPIHAAYTVPWGAQFGAIRDGGARHHQGCDYHCPIGTPIYGTADGGTVTASIGETGFGIGFGNYVEVAYPGGVLTLDGHMREMSPLPVGAAVDSSTIVGYVGLTGNAVYASPPGSHVHHQLWLHGVLTDPAPYYGTGTAGSGGTAIIPDIPIGESTMRVIRSASGTIATITDSAGAKVWSLPQITRAAAEAKVFNPTADYISVTDDELSVLIEEANLRKTVAGSTATVTGGTVDNTAVLSALAELKALIAAEPLPPRTFVAQ